MDQEQGCYADMIIGLRDDRIAELEEEAKRLREENQTLWKRLSIAKKEFEVMHDAMAVEAERLREENQSLSDRLEERELRIEMLGMLKAKYQKRAVMVKREGGGA